MRTVVERARALGAVPTVITFDPHPRAVLHPESAPPLLQTFDQKIEGFGVLGIEQTIVVRFTKEFSNIRAAEFLRDVVMDRLHAREGLSRQGLCFWSQSRRKYRLAAACRRRTWGSLPAKFRRLNCAAVA